ncbi:hypothetical protein LZ554_006597 [Drepanopeziza brunnea f. sp. 'monogermtubi']|nr:hypothetical protein LZ554_006597 [Drepanopeziza brunnea f. sp. 'monogermtubi']
MHRYFSVSFASISRRASLLRLQLQYSNNPNSNSKYPIQSKMPAAIIEQPIQAPEPMSVNTSPLEVEQPSPVARSDELDGNEKGRKLWGDDIPIVIVMCVAGRPP